MRIRHAIVGWVALFFWCAGTAVGQTPAGAGIALRQNPDRTVSIEQVVANGPAARVGILPGDSLLAVNDQAVRQIPFDRIPDLIRGPAGSQVRLWVVTPGSQPRQVVVVRAPLGGGPAEPAIPNQPDRHPSPPAGAPGAPAQSELRFVRAAIRDPAVWNEEAVVLLIPAGWRMEGRIQWLHQHAVLVNPQIQVSDPQTGATVQWLPVQNFIHMPNPPGQVMQWGNYQGKLWAAPIVDGPAFVQAFWMPGALQHLQQARLVHQQELPGLANEYLRLYGGPGVAKAYRLRYEYLVNGQPWEEDVTFALLFTGSQELSLWFVNFATTMRAPKGILDRIRPLTNTMVATAHNPPLWSANLQICQQLFRQGIMAQIRDTEALGLQLAAHREHSWQLSQQIAQEREQSAARRAEAAREYLGAIETYRDPYKDQSIELPAGYKEYWVNARGEYVMSDTWGYNPNHGSTDEWRKMERRDPMNPGHGG